MTPEDLGNMIGFLQIYIIGIQSRLPVLLNPDSTAADLQDAHTSIDSDMNGMYQLLNTACNMKQVQVDQTQLSTDDLTNMNLLNDASGIDIVAQAVDASNAMIASPDKPIAEPMQTATNLSVK